MMILILMCPTWVSAKESFRLGLWNTGLSGSYKSILSFQQLRDQNVFPHETQLVTEQRVRLEAEIAKSWFQVQVANEFQFFLRGANSPKVPLPDFAPASAWSTTSNIANESNYELVNKVDRALVRVGRGEMQLVVGKQAVSTGVGHLFKAVSQVPRRAFAEVDPEYPVSEDAISFLWNGALSMEIRYLPAVGNQNFHNFHIRAKGSKYGYDVAMTAGRSDGKPYVGVEVAGNVGGSLVRGELVTYNDNNQDVIQALVGYDTVFSQRWSADFEIFFNGFGTSGGYTLAPLRHRSTPFVGRWYIGSRVQWETNELIQTSLFLIANIEDPSALLLASVRYSVGEDTELILGQHLSLASEDRSEFGGTLLESNGFGLGLPDITYLALSYYF